MEGLGSHPCYICLKLSLVRMVVALFIFDYALVLPCSLKDRKTLHNVLTVNSMA